jgi:hypothetical protein
MRPVTCAGPTSNRPGGDFAHLAYTRTNPAAISSPATVCNVVGVVPRCCASLRMLAALARRVRVAPLRVFRQRPCANSAERARI